VVSEPPLDDELPPPPQALTKTANAATSNKTRIQRAGLVRIFPLLLYAGRSPLDLRFRRSTVWFSSVRSRRESFLHQC
jgi:hypothetical protein